MPTHHGSNVRPTSGVLASMLAALASFVAGCTGPAPTQPERSAVAEQQASVPAPSPADPDACAEPLPSGPKLFEAWHGHRVFQIEQSEDRILGVGVSDGAWTLWDRQSGRRVANGTFPPYEADLDLDGDTMLVSFARKLEIREARDGSLRRAIETPTNAARARFSVDGSYVYSAGLDQVDVWDRTGALLMSQRFPLRGTDRPVYAASDELRITLQGGRAIETRSVRTNDARTRSFEGSFLAWFTDGHHFISSIYDGTSASIVRVYTEDAELVQTLSLDGYVEAGGEGDLLWVYAKPPNSKVRVYRLGIEAPILEFDATGLAQSPRSFLPVFRMGDRTLASLDLREGMPKLVQHPVPAHEPGAITVDADGRMLHSDGFVVHDLTQPTAGGRSRAFGCAEIQYMVGWGDRLAIAWANRMTRVYSFRTGTPKLVWQLEGVRVNGLGFLDDGRYLAVSGPDDVGTPTTLRIYERDDAGGMKNAALRQESSMAHGSLTTSPYGTQLARTTCIEVKFSVLCRSQGLSFDGRATWTTDPLVVADRSIELSTDGSHTAIGVKVPTDTAIITRTWIYDRAGTLEAEIPGRPLLWLDSERLVGADATDVARPPIIVDARGKTLGTMEAPVVGATKLARGGLFHDDENVYRQSDGKAIWNLWQATGRTRSSAYWRSKTIAGGRFVFVAEDGIYAEPITRGGGRDGAEPFAIQASRTTPD